MVFKKWLAVFISEKGLDREHLFEVPGPSGENLIPLGALEEAMVAAPAHERSKIKDMIVRIDFANGNVMDFFGHLAKAIAI